MIALADGLNQLGIRQEKGVGRRGCIRSRVQDFEQIININYPGQVRSSQSANRIAEMASLVTAETTTRPVIPPAAEAALSALALQPTEKKCGLSGGLSSSKVGIGGQWRACPVSGFEDANER